MSFETIVQESLSTRLQEKHLAYIIQQYAYCSVSKIQLQSPIDTDINHIQFFVYKYKTDILHGVWHERCGLYLVGDDHRIMMLSHDFQIKFSRDISYTRKFIDRVPWDCSTWLEQCKMWFRLKCSQMLENNFKEDVMFVLCDDGDLCLLKEEDLDLELRYPPAYLKNVKWFSILYDYVLVLFNDNIIKLFQYTYEGTLHPVGVEYRFQQGECDFDRITFFYPFIPIINASTFVPLIAQKGNDLFLIN